MTEEEFMELAKAKYAQISKLKEHPTLLEYEQGFVEIWTELARQVVQADLGDAGKDRRKKRKSSALGGQSK